MEDIYTDSFYASMKDKENGCRRAAEYVFGLIRPASVVDIGCGTGAWLGLFKACGAQVHGYDGDYVNREMLVIEQEEFTPYDLSETIPVDRRYDMAMSLEVAEHLDAGCVDRFVADLTQISDVVLFSAAIPGQGGDGHVNEQWPDYWQEKFEANGFVCCDCLRDVFWNMDELNYYYKQNIVLYVNKEKEALIQKLRSMEKRPMMNIVHPITYLKYKSNLELMDFMLNNPGGGYIEKYLKRQGIHSLSIYGTGRIGKCFYDICQKTEINIPFCIDARTDYTIGSIPTRTCQDIRDGEVDGIVVASGYHSEEMIKNIGHLQQTKVFSLMELLRMSQEQDEIVNRE